jgi:hypothetical protein
LIEGSTPRAEAIVAVAALAAAVAAYIAWPIRRERLVRRSIEGAMFAKDVQLLLGEPDQALDVFPGPIASRWIYPPPTLVGGTPIGIRLAIDFDFSDRVTSVQRV